MAKIRQEGTSHILDTVYEGGIDKTAKILSSMASIEALNLLSEITESDQEIGGSLRERCLFFDDLERLNRHDMVTLIREIDRSDLVCALSACSPSLQEKFFSGVSLRMKEELVEDLDILERIPKEQSTKAKRSIVDVAKKLIEDGVIILV